MTKSGKVQKGDRFQRLTGRSARSTLVVLRVLQSTGQALVKSDDISYGPTTKVRLDRLTNGTDYRFIAA